jgi:hypothetical protein
MAQHTHYWTCSNFADWLRGTNKPGAATWEDWETWHDDAKKAHPFRYWLADDCLDFLQDFVTWPTRKLYDAKYYINNRYITKSHALTAHPRDIKPGNWCDVGNRFLPCLFNELVNFVEVETAWNSIAWGGKESREKYAAPWYATGWFRWRTWRCPQAGIDNLTWQSSLKFDDEWTPKDDPAYGKPTPQAINAQEILDLYIWWTQVYRNRPDPWEASGYRAVSDKEKEANGGKFSFTDRQKSPLKKELNRAMKLMNKIERDYEREEEAMMIRLIKVRGSLWT